MSDERKKEIESAEPATPNVPSIMSAPRENRQTERLFIVIGILAVSIILNIFFVISFISKNEQINELKTEVKSNEALILELKTKVNQN